MQSLTFKVSTKRISDKAILSTQYVTIPAASYKTHKQAAEAIYKAMGMKGVKVRTVGSLDKGYSLYFECSVKDGMRYLCEVQKPVNAIPEPKISISIQPEEIQYVETKEFHEKARKLLAMYRAAPVLLEALQFIVDDIAEGVKAKGSWERIARTAIAKATESN